MIQRILPLIHSQPLFLDDVNNTKIINPNYNVKFYNNINNNSDKTIVHVFNYSSGFGDYLRGSIYLAQLVKFFNINLELDISRHTISNCIENKNEMNNIDKPIHSFYYNGDNEYTNKIKLLFLINKFKKSKNKKLYIVTNLNYNINGLSLDIQNYINSYFKFKNFYYDEVKKLFNLTNYNVLHIRCNDDYFNNDFNDNNLISKIEKLDLNENTIVISNNYSLKKTLNKLFGFYFIDSKAVHTANTSNKSDDLYSTIIEYIILSKSSQTYCFSYYKHGSGFSEQCSVLNNVPYTVYYIYNKILEINHAHNAGFFSCFTVTLYELINYFNKNESLPTTLDRSKIFNMYKYDNNDITFDFFKHYNDIHSNIKYKNITNSQSIFGFQFYNYKNVNYIDIVPFIQKYFTPSDKIINIENNLLSKYNIDLDNCIAIYYRGTDKYTETVLDSYNSYYNKLIQIISDNKSINNNFQIIIQTDSAPFLDYMKNKLQSYDIIIIEENSVSYTNVGIHNEKNNIDNYKDMLILLSIMLIMSKCKYLICSSNNVSIVMMFYRYLYKNNVYNVYQNLNLNWLS
jgi:hypothetical protein